MEIILAKNMSFCSGVKIAEKKILDLRERIEDDIYIFGELIHNKIFNDYLREKRIFSSENIEDMKDKIAVIRTHGVSPIVEKKIGELAKRVIDLTCSKVKSVHSIAKEFSEKDFFILITGDPAHPEVKGITGYAKNFKVISTPKEALEIDLPQDKNIVIISQTTFSLKTFEEIVRVIKSRNPDVIVKNTICNATFNRQREAREIAQKSDVVLIIGDKKSSNTKKLYEIAKEINENVFYIEKEEELGNDFFGLIKDDTKIGIVSGASTPIFVIEKVVEKINKRGQK